MIFIVRIQSECMNQSSVLLILFIIGVILCTGCVSSQQGPTAVPAQPVEEIDKAGSPVSGPSSPPSAAIDSSPKQANDVLEEPVSNTISKASDMDGFIRSTFPEITASYTEIKKSRDALEWKKVQDHSQKLQTLIQDYQKTYHLDLPNPEKVVFAGLDSRQQIVLLKYLRFLQDMESYATNLKNAVYYQEKGTDPQSAQTSRRYQNLADQFEKQSIAGVKTISEYAADFKYTFIDPDLAGVYRYVG